MTISPSVHASIFSHLIDECELKLPVVTCSKVTLTHLSHILEDTVIHYQLPALVYSGFQESRHWHKEKDRYHRLAEFAEAVCVFAAQPLQQRDGRELYIHINPDDPLCQEWFVVISSPQFSVLLCGRDIHNHASSEGQREFETIWSFDPQIVAEAVELLENIIGINLPDERIRLRADRLGRHSTLADTELMSNIIIDLIQFEESLNRRLRHKNHLLDTILSTIPHHIYTLIMQPDAGFGIRYESPNIAILLGLEHHQPGLTLRLWEEDFVLSDDRDIVDAHRARLRAGQSSEADYQIQQHDGTVIWIHDVVKIEQDSSSGLLCLYGVMQDISERKMLESQQRERESLRIALEHERQYSDLKTRLMTNVSHQFRTPLASLRTGLEILTRYNDRLSEVQRNERLLGLMQQLNTITGIVDSVTDMLADQLIVPRVQPVRVNISDLVQQMAETFRANLSEGKSFSTQIEDANVLACVDAEIVRFIGEKLLENAAKFSGSTGSITLSLHLEAAAMTLVVEDDGIGIPKADQQFLFDGLFRAKNAENHPGLGLGLRMVHDRVILHGGKMDLHSVEGKGTRVRVRLPFLDSRIP